MLMNLESKRALVAKRARAVASQQRRIKQDQSITICIAVHSLNLIALHK